MSGRGASVFSISPRVSFADALATTLLHERDAADPLALARITILLPTRRARRTLKDAFLRRSGGQPLILPRLVTVSDLDDDEALFASFAADGFAAVEDIPPVLPPLRRHLLLTRLVMAAPPPSGTPWTAAQAARLAQDLAHLIDQVQTEGLGFEALASLVPEDYAAHWRITLDFLKIITEFWPRILEDEGCLDPAERRNRLLLAQSRAWEAAPPPFPILAAGLTGSVPAVARLLATVAHLPLGRVVLPGLDRHLDAESWEAVDPCHPQAALKSLLERIGLSRAEVAEWPLAPEVEDNAAPKGREILISEALRPAATTHRWRSLPPLGPEALDDRRTKATVERLDCPTPREEALAIALILRETVEHPTRTGALVTPDRDLARRVAAELERWDIRLDDSAGTPLAVTPVGAFLRLLAGAVQEEFAPVSLLALLKHPLASGGMATAAFRDTVRLLEINVLRGVRPAPGLAGLRAALLAGRGEEDTASPEVFDHLGTFLDRLEELFASFCHVMATPEATLADLLESHMTTAEALAASDDTPGPLRLWAGDAGETAAAFAADLAAGAEVLGAIAPSSYPALFDALLQGQGVRGEIGLHPRLALLGPMESRLHHADVMILGGLNEGVWPPSITADPWMSRPMRTRFGLPAPEQRVGHAAFDFANAFCAPRVILTRSEKVEGTPTVPSRWLLRLETVIEAASLSPLAPSAPWLSWAEALDTPARFETPTPPAPTPPVAARPRRLSATRIETLMRDPYAIYARFILGLRALDPLDAEPGPADYGRLIHGAFEDFRRRFPTHLPADIEGELLASGRKIFAEDIARPAVAAFWWPRFERVAAWVAEVEKARSEKTEQTWVEVSGSLDLGGFEITAKADRIDALRDGTVEVLDYKTGKPPSAKDVAAGFSPQLPIEALIAQHGGFAAAGVPSRPVSGLLYWHLSGSDEGGKQVSAVDKNKTPAELIDEALEGVRGLIAAFDRPETPYLARPLPDKAPGYSDYQHLARVKEWSSGADDDGGSDE